MRELGFDLTETRPVSYELLAGSPNPSHASDNWRVFTRLDVPATCGDEGDATVAQAASA
jgi:hypothetical protein